MNGVISKILNGLCLTLVIALMSGCLNANLKLKRVPSSATPSPTPLPVTVDAVYSNAQQWMDYVGNDGANVYSANNIACTAPASSYYSSCIHGAEIKKVIITGETSCTNLTITDQLGAFNWKCVVASGTATFYSLGMKENKFLSDLIVSTSFKDNQVTVRKSGAVFAMSSPAKWWTNTVALVPVSGALNTAGTIYTLPSVGSSATLTTTGNKIALVAVNNPATNDLTSVTFGATCTYCWLEGNYVSTNFTGTTKFSRIQNFATDTASSFSITSTSGILYSFSSASTLTLSGGSFNILSKIKISQGGAGIILNSSASNLISRATLSNNANDGTTLIASDKVTLHLVTSISNGYTGIRAQNATQTTVSQAISTNNGSGGISYYSSSTARPATNASIFHQFSQVALTQNSQPISIGRYEGVVDATRATVSVSQNMLLSSTACSTYHLNGLDSGTCASAATNTYTAKDLSTSFVGRVFADGSNSGNSSGSNTVAAADFFHFDNFFRAWGGNTSTFSSNMGRSAGTPANVMSIWDWRTNNSDTAIRNRSNDGSTANAAFVVGGTCPSAVDGNKSITDYNSITYLVNAAEIPGMGGNNNGLCESGETCVYQPNYGSYLGEGAYTSDTCTFQNGTISGVQMFGYTTNGG